MREKTLAQVGAFVREKTLAQVGAFVREKPVVVTLSSTTVPKVVRHYYNIIAAMGGVGGDCTRLRE